MPTKDETEIVYHGTDGGMTLTGDAVHLYRVLNIRMGLSLFIKTDGKLRLTRTASPKHLLTLTTELTQKKYPNSKKGWAAAVADLDTRVAALQASIPTRTEETT
jgi:hypothetical protein